MVRAFGYALNIGVAAAILAGCGGRADDGALPPANAFPTVARHSKTFYYTGTRQVFTVPRDVRKITVVAVGARGAGPTQAFGGRVWAVIPVQPGERLWVYVGGQGSGLSGGFNGGADGGQGFASACRCNGYGGGGASDIRRGRDEPVNRVVVVVGGGGDGGTFLGRLDRGGVGGKGGGSVGAMGACGNSDLNRYGCVPNFFCIGGGGYGGTQHHGGPGGFGSSCYVGSSGPGGHGTFLVGGAGGTGRASTGDTYFNALGGGGGGGGYYGGGGGGAGASYASGQLAGGGGGGGGGSSYIAPSAIAYRSWQGWRIKTPNGLVVFAW